MSTLMKSQGCCAPTAAADAGKEPAKRWATPRVDIAENADGFTLRADMPGVNKDSLEVTLEEDTLTLAGNRAVGNKDAKALHRESRKLDYRRQFTLGDAVDRQRISAKVEHGVVTITLPKKEVVKPRKIEVA